MTFEYIELIELIELMLCYTVLYCCAVVLFYDMI